MELEYDRADLGKGLTFWKFGDKTYSLKYGDGKIMEKLSSMNPLVVRSKWGIPDNFYFVTWDKGIIKVSLGMFNHFFKEVKE